MSTERDGRWHSSAEAPSALRDAVWPALGTVLDPELDEPITDLDFVESWTVSAEGVATVGLRLPTFFCAPNFSFLMVADAYDAVSAVAGVTRADVTLADHHASAEINGGVAAQAGFVKSFEGSDQGEAVAELDELRLQFFRRRRWPARTGSPGRWSTPASGPDELAAMNLGAVPPSRGPGPDAGTPRGAGSAARRRRAAADRRRRQPDHPGAGAAAPAAGAAAAGRASRRTASSARACWPSGTASGCAARERLTRPPGPSASPGAPRVVRTRNRLTSR